MTRRVLLALIALAAGCGPPALTCQTQPCPSGSGKTYQLCVNIDASETWNFGGMSCHASSTNASAVEGCEQMVDAYCGGNAGGANPDMANGGSNCSVVGSFRAITGTGGMATMVDNGTAQSGTSQLTIITSNNMTIMISADYSVSGNDVTMTNTSSSPSTVQGCIGQPAVYAMTWSADCSQLTLNKVSDACQGRIADANGTTLTRQ